MDRVELDGFLRLNPAGDGRHLLVSTTGGYQVFDAGTWSEPHGDHAHHYTAPPELTDVTFPAEEPGHAVVHAGRSALFDDGTGNVAVMDSSGVVEGGGDDARRLTTPSPHHGVAIERADGSLIVVEGTKEARTGTRILDADGAELAASTECPGVHGEATAADEVVVIGCEDGALIHDGQDITKVDSPDEYGRIGNQAGTEDSPVVLGDYKTDPDAEWERPARVSLIDTRNGELQLVDLPSSYSLRSLARGPAGQALVLGTDGSLHVVDPESGELASSIPVVQPWREPLDWQQPRPTVQVLGGTAYVTEPDRSMVHAVDLEAGEVRASAELDVAPNEMAMAFAGASDHEGHDH